MMSKKEIAARLRSESEGMVVRWYERGQRTFLTHDRLGYWAIERMLQVLGIGEVCRVRVSDDSSPGGYNVEHRAFALLLAAEILEDE